MDYHPTQVLRSARPHAKHSPDSRYWRSFKHPVFIKEYAPITSVHFSPAKPHRYAVTVATRVQVYAPRTQKVTKSISRFKDVARSGCIRADGKLIAAGDDTGLIQVFDVNSRAILRTLNSHRQPVHLTTFSPLTQTQLMSASDDTTVRLWDVPSESEIHVFKDHTDYVRTGQVSPSNPNILVSGSYDRTVRIFDARTGACEMTLGGGEHSHPVERVLLFPSSTLLVSASGPIIRTWDLVAGGRCLRALSNHQKTITSLALSSDSRRLLSGSLDHLVKVYDTETYKVVHSMRYPAPILCLGLSPDDTHLVAGMSDGTLSIRRRQPKPSQLVPDNNPFSTTALRSGTYESFLGGALPSVGQGSLSKRDGQVKQIASDANEFKVQSQRKRKLKIYDKLLKSFNYSAALDSVLEKNVLPATSFAVISELAHLDALRIAVAGRDDVTLEPLLRLVLKHVTDPRFGQLCCAVAGVIIETYSSLLGQSPVMDSLFLRLRRKVSEELRFQRELTRVKGALDMILASSALSA
ncbi:WD40 repeat-like protein [Sistotremastrum suecicum HHB10207 ss-3]|uniref:WD40 repeat-like protein n=1 Tax=Sistotremastrum suecicum HHB10207 ss-3 TaxID=1314776 RepID=A0A166FZ54_9AGAM|nr:WD40 repeat-like protein [Sistotremastrum suecicum HHB10207 ss-3]